VIAMSTRSCDSLALLSETQHFASSRKFNRAVMAGVPIRSTSSNVVEINAHDLGRWARETGQDQAFIQIRLAQALCNCSAYERRPLRQLRDAGRTSSFLAGVRHIRAASQEGCKDGLIFRRIGGILDAADAGHNYLT